MAGWPGSLDQAGSTDEGYMSLTSDGVNPAPFIYELHEQNKLPVISELGYAAYKVAMMGPSSWDTHKDKIKGAGTLPGPWAC